MGTAGVLLLLVLLAAIATGVVGYIIINRCKRQQAQISAGNLQREAQRKAEEERQRWEAEEAQRRAEEERQRLEAEEAQWKAEEERQRREAEEAHRKAEEVQRKAEEEHLRREAEETQRKAEEERQRREAEQTQQKTEAERQRRQTEEALRKGEEERESQEEGRQVPLDHRPPRRPTEGDEKQLSREIKPRRPKPEVVCWQRERRWILAVEVPEDLWEKPKLVVDQNASPLAQDEREGHWRLDQVCGQVTVHWNEDEAPEEAKITLGEENYLLFKLSGQDWKQGRRVKSPSSGSYLVVVPESWERDENLSGSPPASPEPVSVEGCQGHFFDLGKGGNKRIAFRTSEGKSIPIKSKAARFELVGNQLSDASEGIGPLFGKSSPRIRALHDRPWTDIGTIVVGEEGSGRGRWRKSFSPAPEEMEQKLPAEAAPSKDGWYFLRFYDTNDDLVESLDFRLVIALQEIKIFQPSLFPSETQHGPVYVEFIHESDCAMQPADDLARSIQVEGKGNKTRLTIPPSPIYDETGWRVGSKGTPQMHITILVERLWWIVGQEGTLPLEWEDELVCLTCDDFAATSKKALWLRLPKRRWTDEVLVGFERSRADRCAIQVTRGDVAKPLRDFVTFKEITDREHEHLLKVWIERDNEVVMGVAAKIPVHYAAPSDVPTPSKPTILRTQALCKGGNVIYGNCRHCRSKAREIRAK